MTRDIVVNGRFLSRRITGVERYGREILSVIGSKVQVEKTPLNGIAGHAWEQFVLPTKLWNRPNGSRNSEDQASRYFNDSILWSPANTGSLFVRNQALTIHDLSPLEHPEWFRTSFAVWYRLFLPLLARRVRIIFTPSEYVKKKVKKHFGVDNVTITPNGVDTSVFHPTAKQTLNGIPEKYVLFVGSIQPRKNLMALLEAWYEIKYEFKDIFLVIAGEAGHVFRTPKFTSSERVRFLNYVSDHDLPGLYANAELFVLPSLDEGFGLPALEAMACGIPVLVSNGGALPEVVGEAAVIFDAGKTDNLKVSLTCCLQNKDLRGSLREKGLVRARAFSWQYTAALIWKMLNEI
jgi:glycosyltransferase involved in cell wall biosynthesis